MSMVIINGRMGLWRLVWHMSVWAEVVILCSGVHGTCKIGPTEDYYDDHKTIIER